MRTALAALLLFAAGAAQADEPGRYDYWVLALSWSPQYCAEAGKRGAGEPQCMRPYAFVVHGLWPQYERGYPDNCGKVEYLDDSLIRRMLPLMPSKGLVIHEWRKHGSCSGLDAKHYFAKVEQAYASLNLPARYQLPQDYISSNVRSIENDFIAANPKLRPNGLALQCGGRYLKEIRVCLDKSLQPRACGSDLADRCGREVALRPSRGG